MKFFIKSIHALALSTIIISNVQSAGIVKLAKINNQSDKSFRFLFYRQVDVPSMFGITFSKDKSGHSIIQPNSTEKINLEIVNIGKSQAGERFYLTPVAPISNEEVKQQITTNMPNNLESKHIGISNNAIVLSSGFSSTSEIISSELIDLNFDYSINLVIKPDFTIQMHVIQE